MTIRGSQSLLDGGRRHPGRDAVFRLAGEGGGQRVACAGGIDEVDGPGGLIQAADQVCGRPTPGPNRQSSRRVRVRFCPVVRFSVRYRPAARRVGPLLKRNNAISITRTHILPHDPTIH